MGIFDRFTGASDESIELLEQIRGLSQDNLVLAESYSALARATLEFDEKGWSPLNQLSDNGIRLEDVKSIMERIPGAGKLFADALGIGTQEMYDLISAGGLGREEMVKIGEELRRVYDDGAKVEGLAPAWERFTNTITVSASKMYEASGAGNALGGALDIITQGAGFVAVGFGTLAARVEQAGKTLGAVAAWASGNTSWEELGQNIAEASDQASAKISKLADDVFSLNDENAKVPAAAGSAGAAMAVVLGETYPELFAAVGAHSGLPYAAAHDIPSAMAAMKGHSPMGMGHLPGTPADPRRQARHMRERGLRPDRWIRPNARHDHRIR
jgi:tape measure domain-containing protein